LVQVAPQVVTPVAQAQRPAEHIPPGPQRTPQPPQFCEFEVAFTQTPPHAS
jgi:hypothetical protein